MEYHLDYEPYDQTILKQEANEVIIPSYEGQMGILNNHIPLITFLRPGIITIKGTNVEKNFFIKEGTVEFSNNNLLILTSTARDLANEIKPVLFDIITEISETPKGNMNPTELKGMLDVCYKIIAQIYGMGNPQVQVTNVEYPQINFKWDWEQDEDT